MTTINMHMKFEIEISKHTWLTLRKPCHLQSSETEKSNMAARRPFWKWRCWKSIGSYPYKFVLCRWSFKLKFKAKVKLESGNQKIQYGRQAAILKVTSLKINRLLPMATINMHMKFKIEIPKQTWLMLRKPCRLQTDGQTDGRTDGQGESSIPPPPPPPPPTSLGGGIKINQFHRSQNVPAPYPTMRNSEQKCAHFCSEWCIVGYGTGAFWDLWIRPIVFHALHDSSSAGAVRLELKLCPNDYVEPTLLRSWVYLIRPQPSGAWQTSPTLRSLSSLSFFSIHSFCGI